jgi:hypothetical protein
LSRLTRAYSLTPYASLAQRTSRGPVKAGYVALRGCNFAHRARSAIDAVWRYGVLSSSRARMMVPVQSSFVLENYSRPRRDHTPRAVRSRGGFGGTTRIYRLRRSHLPRRSNCGSGPAGPPARQGRIHSLKGEVWKGLGRQTVDPGPAGKPLRSADPDGPSDALSEEWPQEVLLRCVHKLHEIRPS